jgi:tRNA pseudouridine55 synthase
LARDLALAAGSRAHLAALTRTRFAGFDLSEAVSGGGEGGEGLAEALLPIDKTVLEALGLPWFDLEPEYMQEIIHGKPLSQVLAGKQPGHGEAPAAGIFCGGVFAGIIEQRPGKDGEKAWAYGYVYAAGQGGAGAGA